MIDADAEKLGIRKIGLWATMGKYDVVGIYEAPDDQTMAGFLLGLGKLGNVTTQTLRAFSEDEFRQVTGRLS